MKKTSALAIAPLFLAACGGGGGGSDGGTTPPPAANAPPSFTSAQTASLVENGVAAYQATATDPDGNALTFTIDGGADASLLSITAAGALSFKAAPDYDLPGDADGDNVYAVQLRVSDGRASVTQLVNVTVTNSREGISLVRVATFTATDLAAIPGDSRVYIGSNTGIIYRFDPATGERTPVLEIPDVTDPRFRAGFSLAASPDHASSRRLIVFLVSDYTLAGPTLEVRSYTLGEPDTASNYHTLVLMPSPSGGEFNSGALGSLSWVGFGPDGYLYMALGDGGWVVGGAYGTLSMYAQNLNVKFGKVLRAAISSDGSTISPAPGNPFIGGGGDPFIFALGLFSPDHAAFYESTLIIGEMGRSQTNEIDLMPLDTPRLNFGWPYKEGTFHYSGVAPAGLTPPAIEVPDGGSTRGGYVYRGPVASLRGQYIFAQIEDEGPSNILSVPFSRLQQGQTLGRSQAALRNDDFTPDVGAVGRINGFGEDSAGNLFILAQGGIFMVRQGS
ncbi:MAG: PQQ-dependent sugar dehydrogenase [Sphingopyxis sp.]|uniref:PQQ-dependent sugar dehydrogenase n=1 Tax=Sphingopyxis sp. TaxID=1908224 RepID=UPI003D80C110